MPVGGIRIQSGDDSIVFAPAEDITAREVAMVFQMFINGIMHRGPGKLDFGSYIVGNNLQRHFVAITDEPKEQE